MESWPSSPYFERSLQNPIKVENGNGTYEKENNFITEI